MTGRKATPIVLDVDTGIDDALALAFAVKSPQIDLLAVTTVAGNVGIEATTQNSLDVLDYIGANDVPVHCGATRPLIRPHRDARFVHGSNGLGGAKLPRSSRLLGTDKGPASIIRIAKQMPGELTLVCVGPLTNLAIALNVAPELPALLKRLVIMGGAYKAPGNITEFAEFNFFCDPEAASLVLQTNFPEIIAIGLDVSHQCALSKSDWELMESNKAPTAQLTWQVLKQRFTEHGVSGAYLHDPLAVAVAVDRSLVKTEPWSIRIHAGADERGAVELAHPAVVEVATEVDSDRFISTFKETLELQ